MMGLATESRSSELRLCDNSSRQYGFFIYSLELDPAVRTRKTVPESAIEMSNIC
ncbi:hypothetical protein NJ7G_2630 [Natrinema sp. J7-2]|nr:hypothetical protein NJ7G_2630 [Natrinema sp. J7-2]